MADFRRFTLVLWALLPLFDPMKSQPEVVANSGPIRGITNDVLGVNVSTFLGIPYAKPPVGSLRFRTPVPIEPWADTLNATEFGNICPQNQASVDRFKDLLQHTRIDEDCLTLNIFKPADVDSVDLAVMVFIHGGGFVFGTTMLYDGSTLAALYNVVIITVNYRLGAFGFLSTMDKYSTGNFGLLDQQLAVRWVKANIAAFGGDPNKITLFGESAGGMSVGFQLLSPTNNGLFQRGISQSGAATNLDMADKPVYWARRLGSALNCTSRENHRQLISCLKSKTWQEIIDNTPDVESSDVWMRQFAPVVDGQFVVAKPEMAMVSNSNFSNYDYLLGFNSNEGKYIYLFQHFHAFVGGDLTLSPGLTEGHFQQLIRDSVTPYYEDDFSLILDAIFNHYTDWSDPSSDHSRLLNYFKFTGDQIFVSPTIDAARKHSMLTAGDHVTYVYQFSYDNGDPVYPEWLNGAAHTDELQYVFGSPFRFPWVYTDENRDLSSTVMKYWTNFAKTGNPNVGEEVNVSWPLYTVEDQKYVDLNKQVTIGERPKAEDVAFWLNYVPRLGAVTWPTTPEPEKCIFGEDLGLYLTDSAVTKLLKGFIAAIILLLFILATVLGALYGYVLKVRSARQNYQKLKGVTERLEKVQSSLDNDTVTGNGIGNDTNDQSEITEL